MEWETDSGTDSGEALCPGSICRAAAREWVGKVLWLDIFETSGQTAVGRLETEDWHWPEDAIDRTPRVREGDSIIVTILECETSGEYRVATADPWDDFLPRFFGKHQGRIFRGRIVEVDDERIVVSVIDRLVGEPDGVLGEITAESLPLEMPLPLSLFFEVNDILPVIVSEVDAGEGRLVYESPWTDRDPWQEGYIDRHYDVGTTHLGTVVRLEPDWVGVELEPGILARMAHSTEGRYGIGVSVTVRVTTVDDEDCLIHVAREK